MPQPLLNPARRDWLIRTALAGTAVSLGLPAWAATATKDPRHDWDWLVGDFDVWHKRLKHRLAGNNEWEAFGGKSVLWLALGGLGTVDDNIVELPDGVYRGLTVRAFDPATQEWAIWWVDGRSGRIDPPVRGRFAADSGEFVGPDTFEGRPILMRFRWLDIHSKQPHWEQAFSPDNGRSWEVNWENFFTRTSAKPTPLPRVAGASKDWDFLEGRWKVQHRRLRERLVGSKAWDEFGGTLVNWAVLGGNGNISDNVMDFPGAPFRGIGLRVFDPASGQWISRWLDGRKPTEFAAPLRGGFRDGVGTFTGEDAVGVKRVITRVTWSKITAKSARWEQASSGDGGKSWETNWVSDFTRES